MDSATRLFRSIAFDRFGSQILETAEAVSYTHLTLPTILRV